MKRISSHKIKQYLQQPDGELDLHGLSKAQALAELEVFLQRAERLEWQRVKVITGRGLNSPEGFSIVKESTLTWLKNNHYKHRIAKIKEGGAGCIIVTIN